MIKNNPPSLTQSSWLIIGLGWLGQALYDQLKADGVSVSGTHRLQCDLLQDELPETQCDVLFLNTPPLVELAPELYVKKVAKTHASRVIFISSTSVYGMSAGEVDEYSTPLPDSPGGQWLYAVETQLRQALGTRLLVIRPGGLIGGARHPVTFLANRRGVSGGNERVNLIHREDLIGIIRSTPQDLALVNAISPYHPTKADYYSFHAQQRGLVPPQFVDSPFSSRVINSCVVASFYQDWRCRQLDWV